MHRWKMFVAWLALLSLTFIVPGCLPGDQSRETGQMADLMAGIQAVQPQQVPDVPGETIRWSISGFAGDLFLASAANPGNVMISPASVYLALAMTLNGADGDTKAAMLQVLADEGITVDMINQACRDWMTHMSETGGKTELGLANSIWYDHDFVPYRPFLQKNADYFGAGVRALDFQDQGTPAIINAWVKEATKAKIDTIVEQIDPDVVMYLINAIYFKSEWQTPFLPGNTFQQAFNTPGETVQTAFLHRTGTMSYFSGHGAAGVMLPYDDGQYAYFALLPDGSATPREWLTKQGKDNLFANISAMIAAKQDLQVELALPRYESRYEDSLKDELSQMGMSIALDRYHADFSQMNEKHTRDLYISEVKHKTFIRVDEKGTEAAAATAVEISLTGIPMVDKQLILDRPFIYGILDLQTGWPLFGGIMEDPRG